MKTQSGERLSCSCSSYSTTTTMALLLFFTFSLSSISTMADFNSPPPLSGDRRKNYIIFVVSSSSSSSSSSSRHDIQSFAIKTLENILGSQKAAMESLGYIYRNVGTGFSAALTPHQASLLKKEPGVISVIESKVHHLNSHPDLVFDEGSNIDGGC